MSSRPTRSLAVVALLALGDYLVWNWSLGANRGVVALVSGVALVPLLIALAWLVVVALVRLLAYTARRSGAGAAAPAGARGRARGRQAGGRPVRAGASAAVGTSGGEASLGEPAAAAASGGAPSSQLAA